MSQLKVNSIVPVGGLPSGASGGGVIQVVTATHSTQVTQASNGNGNTQTTLTDTGLTASITPSSNSSKVLVMVNQQYGFDDGGSRQMHYNFVVRDSSNNNLNGGVNVNSSGEGTLRYKTLEAFYQYYNCHFLHSPSTTSAFTYKVSMNLYVVYGGTSTMIAQRHGYPSTITLLEVTG